MKLMQKISWMQRLKILPFLNAKVFYGHVFPCLELITFDDDASIALL